MAIFIAADHRGFDMKNRLIAYLQEQNVRVEDMGNYENDPVDDAPLFATKVAKAIQEDPENHKGIVICGSGVAMSIMMNRHKGVRCALALNQDHVKSAREHNHVNGLAIGADYTNTKEAKEIINLFLSTSVINAEKYLRRIGQMD